MNYGKFTGIGIGPGNPELITIRALNALKDVDCICTPRSRNKEESIAHDIVRQYCAGKEIIDMTYSMSPDHNVRESFWRQHAQDIVRRCVNGSHVAFVTLGDPGLYSTFAYVSQLVRELSPETPVEIIPGITSVSASTAALGISLAQAEETVTIQPCSQVLGKDIQWWNGFDCIVIMKIGRKLPVLIARLNELAIIDRAVLVKQAGFSAQQIIKGRELLLCPEELGYLATIIVKSGCITGKELN